MKERNKQIQRDKAETIALMALGYIAEDPARLMSFSDASGIGLADLKARTDDPDMLAAVLVHVMSDDAGLLMFSANAGIRPEDVARALTVLDPTAERIAIST